MEEKRSIVHLDLDTFFVSVERLFDDRLKGKPILIGGSKRPWSCRLLQLRSPKVWRALRHAHAHRQTALSGSNCRARRF